MKFQLWLSKKISKISSRFVWIMLAVIMVTIIVVPLLGTLIPGLQGLSRFWVDIFADDSMRDIAYNNSDNLGLASTIAFALGILVFSGVLVPVVTNYLISLGDSYQNGSLNSYPWKRHALFLGYDKLMTGTVRYACQRYDKVIVAVPSEVAQTRETIYRQLPNEACKIEVVLCNQLQIDDLMCRARIMFAERIYIVGCEEEEMHDSVNMKTLAIIANQWCERLSSKPDSHAPHIMAYFRSLSTFAILQRRGLDAVSLWKLVGKDLQGDSDALPEQVFLNRHCECFNFYNDVAVGLFSAHEGLRLDWHSAEKNLGVSPTLRTHLVVLGMTETGTAVVHECLRLAHPSGQGTRMKITMADADAYRVMHRLIGRYQELFSLCCYSFRNPDDGEHDFVVTPQKDFLDVEFEFIQCDSFHPALAENLKRCALENNELMTVVVCGEDSTMNLDTVIGLPHELLSGTTAIPVWVLQDRDDSMATLLDGDHYPLVRTFALSDHVVEDTATSPRFERARTMASNYGNLYGSDAGLTMSSGQRWGEKSSLERWSSIYSSLSKEIKLRSIGATVGKPLSEEQLLRIDRIEHDRWTVEKLCNGFIPTTVEQHQAVVLELEECQKAHPNWKDDNDELNAFEKGRVYFNALKNGKVVKGVYIHDDIRSFEELDDFTRYKDRLMNQ